MYYNNKYSFFNLICLDPYMYKDPLLFRRIPLLFLFNDILLPHLFVIPFAIMVSARSTTFLLVFILLLLRFSTAHTQQHQGKKTMVVAKLETTTSPVNVESYHGVQRTRFPQGRKMMSRGLLLKSNVVESENGINMTKGKGVLDLKNKDSKRSNGHSTKVKMSDSVSLNADYYVPRPHPPKNN